MKLIGRERLTDFVNKHSDVSSWIGCWIVEVENASWRTPNDIKAGFSSASFLAKNSVIFNVKGNKYRLAVIVAYATQIVVVTWIGTHAEYSRKNF
jgi:mRNA interferase HigB